jgi:homoserine O-acetyltransferase
MKTRLLLIRAITTTALCGWVFGVWAQNLLTEKKVFTLPIYQTVGGATLKNVKVGYETYGILNAAGDNAIFVAHFYSGTSHAAGKYKVSDAVSGYWDSIIGPNKPVDTNRYFVVSADTLSNLNTKDPNVTTTGPASINPDTGKPYGMSFPVISMRDSVRVHKALTDSLGIKKFQAVMGASGGSIQAMEWGALYPDQVERVIHVIGPGFSITPWTIALLEAWVGPIRQDPKWNNGDYYGKAEPVDGVAQSLKLVGITTRSWGFDERVFGYKPAEADKPPAAAMDNKFLVEAAFIKAGTARAALSDANSNLYMSKANQLFNVEADVAGMKSKILFIPAKSDLIFPPVFAKSAAAKYKALGKTAEVFELEGDGGHLDGIFNIAQAGQTIQDFLSR